MQHDSRKILLVHAPTADSEELFRGAPMSLLYAVSVLYQRLEGGAYPPFSVEDVVLFDPALTDVRNPEGAVERFSRLLKDKPPALVAIGTTSYAFSWAVRMAREVKKIYPACPVVVGGPHEDEYGSVGPGASISDHSDVFDFSVQGDGEYLFVFLFAELYRNNFDADGVKATLLNYPSKVESCEGYGAVSFQESNGQTCILRTSPSYKPGLALRSYKPLDLNRLPLPPRRLLSEEHNRLFSIFVHPDGTPKRTAQMMTHRGCPFSCNFCTERGSYTGRTVESVLKEILHLKDQGYEAIFFDDSTFHLYEHLSDLLIELRHLRNELKMEFGCLTRADLVVRRKNRYPLEAFAEAGFTYFYLGLEHYDDAVLREMQKGYGTSDIDQCLALVEDSDIRLGVSLLFGFNNETQASRKKTLELVAWHPKIILVNLSIIAYHPGSTEVQSKQLNIRYDSPAPNKEREWDLFEEGRWHHPSFVDLEYARSIHQLVRQVDKETGGQLIPKLKRTKEVLGPRRTEGSPTKGFVKDSGAIRPMRAKQHH